MIAHEAGTSVDTIYSTFGSKSELLMAAVDVAIVGDDEDAAMVDRPDFALLGKGRRIERLRAGVQYTISVYQRSVPILKALQEAAASDEAARQRLARYHEDRRDVMVAGLALILGSQANNEVVDAIWALVSPEVFTYLTEGRRWPLARTEDWLVDMSRAALTRAGRH
jgi:AcrR family transcriptional regulator